MADQAITALPKKTYSGSSKIAATDYLLGIDSAEGYQMLIQDLGEYIINKATASLAGSTQTLASAIGALNSTTSWHTVPSSVTTIASFQDYIDNQIATNGFFYGYMTANVSVNAGLGNIGHYIFAEANSTNYRFVQAVSSNSNNKYTMIKFNGTWMNWITAPTRTEVDEIKTTTHPNITDVLTPAQDVTILHSYVSVRNGLVILDCHFSQTSTTKTDRFTFKTGYKPIASNTNIAPIFMYANNAVSGSVLFINTTVLTIFGATPVANQEYYFRLVYFNE